MNRLIASVLSMTAVAVAFAAPAAGAVDGFTIVNQTGGALSGIALRRVGNDRWHPLGIAPAAGASARTDFKDNDCAFDVRGTVAGVGQLIWKAANLCDVKSVTLNRDRNGRQWVDYD